MTRLRNNPKRGKLLPEIALRVEKLRFKAGLATILKSVSFELNAGEILVLLGPNGAGKSTLLKCLAGLLPHTGTKTIFGGQLKKNYALRSSIGYLGHETFLYPKLSALENLLFYARLYNVKIDAQNILQEYQLDAASDQLVETFSRGMKQRLSLARALLSDPKLLLMDEPFTGLDQQGVIALDSKIATMRGRIAMIIATHELERAYEMADKVLILKNGAPIFYGTKQEVGSEIQEFYRLKTT